MQFAPTTEQEEALLYYRTAQDLVIDAAAGSGKTSTLELMARYAPQRRGVYLAFNRSVSQEAVARFAGTAVKPMTLHSLALGQVRHMFPRHRLDGMGRFTPWGVVAQRLGIDSAFTSGGVTVNRERLTRSALDTMKAFTSSVDPHLTMGHVMLPRTLTASDAVRSELSMYVLELASTIWADWMSPEGTLPLQHDTYLKTWHLSNPTINADFITLDEAQDADELMLDVLMKQSCQRILVGDEAQSIYGWRGATNGMRALPGASRAQLSQSFRFGQGIADEAQKWLNLMGSDMQIKGNPARNSMVREQIAGPAAIICRTNAGAIAEVLSSLERNQKVGIAGERKMNELVKLARAAVQLRDKGSTTHQDLQSFSSWDELSDYSKTDDGAEFASFVNLVNRFGSNRMVKAIESCNTHGADVVVSTAHVAKGLEWSSVQVSDDFSKPKETDDDRYELRAEEARVAYVTVTRAKDSLGRGGDKGGLNWIDTIPHDSIDLR